MPRQPHPEANACTVSAAHACVLHCRAILIDRGAPQPCVQPSLTCAVLLCLVVLSQVRNAQAVVFEPCKGSVRAAQSRFDAMDSCKLPAAGMTHGMLTRIRYAFAALCP